MNGLEDHDPGVGQRLKNFRQMHDLSQRELAKRAGVSNAVISLIEQNKSSPSVGMLKKVLAGIPVSLADFFSLEQSPRSRIFYRADELFEIAGGDVSYRQVGRDLRGRAMQVLYERYTPGADTGEALLRHDAEEAGVVIRGELEVTVGDQRRILKTGEAFYFDSRVPHRFRNTGDEICEVITACTPPSF